MADYSELKRKAQEIRNEVKAGANTANRVGLAIEELVNALEAENQRAQGAEAGKQNTLQKYQEADSQTTIQSPVLSDGYYSTLILQPEQAAVVHFVDSLGNGTGVFATDKTIEFYTNVSQGKTPLRIHADESDSGRIELRSREGRILTEDLAQTIADLMKFANIEPVTTASAEDYED